MQADAFADRFGIGHRITGYHAAELAVSARAECCLSDIGPRHLIEIR